MRIISVVEGKVPRSKIESFETSYEVLRHRPKPAGWMRSSLLKNSKKSGVYRIETVWEDQESFDSMICSVPRPTASELFENVGVTPTVEVFEIAQSLP